MNKQLTLTKKQLRDIGFKRTRVAYYEIACLNGVFYCNCNQPIYKWYQKIIIGELANFIHLDISSLPQLFSLLQSFRIKFNLVII